VFVEIHFSLTGGGKIIATRARGGNEVRLWLSVIAYCLENLWRRLVLPKSMVREAIGGALPKPRKKTERPHLPDHGPPSTRTVPRWFTDCRFC
jgi:hypothetical protein